MRFRGVLLAAWWPSSLVASAGPAAAVETTFVDAAGLHVVDVVRLDERQYDVTLLSDAIGHPLQVRLLLPVGYDSSASRDPSLYLYTGTGGSHSDWAQFGGVVEATADLPLITVMPDVGLPGQTASSFFVDWFDPTTTWGPSQWETFQVDQLIPWVDANLRTVAGREGRAVAGLSQGGFGALLYAVRNPDRYTSVASFSGLAVIDTTLAIAATATVFVAGISAANGVGPDTFLGSRLTDQANWMGHDPGDLIENLRPLDTWLFTGNGVPGPLDSGLPDPAASAIEVLGHTMTATFGQRAGEVGMPITYLDNGPGTHTFAYWARDLRDYLPALMARFADPPAPSPVDYQSIDAEWTQWGWTVSFERDAARELSRLRDASATGFVLQGTGAATVRTPPSYEPGATLAVTVNGSTATATADDTGSLTLDVPLGGTPTALVPGVPDTLATAGLAEVTIATTDRNAAPTATLPNTSAAVDPGSANRGTLPATGATHAPALAALVLVLAVGLRRKVRST
jgi:S-formylglutathione hydrolase FrmB